MRRFLLFILLFFFTLPLHAETVSDIPNPRQNGSWVADRANVIDATTERKINDLITQLYRKNGAEMAVVTIQTLDGNPIEDFANELFRKWGIGKKGTDNGVLILAAVKDRKMRIEVGYGLEGDLPDGKVGALQRDILRPAFRNGDYGGGLYDCVAAIVRVVDPSIQPNAAAPIAPVNPPSSNSPYIPSQPLYPDDNYSPRNSGGSGAAIFILLAVLCPFVMIGGFITSMFYLVKRPRRCPQCNATLEQLRGSQENPYLTEVQQFEQQIGARDYEVWRCPNGHFEQVVPHDRITSSYQECPVCHNHTARVTSEVIEQPTYRSPGVEQVVTQCSWKECGQQTVQNRVLERYYQDNNFGTGLIIGSVLGNSHNHSNDWGSSSSSNDSGGWSSSDSSSSYDSGPSDFGGGDSGGGGASSDW